MDFVKYRVKVMENFKDGNILGGKFLRANDIVVISEQDFAKVVNSGGVLEIMETLVPNPKKELPEVEEVKALQAQVEELEAQVKAQEEAQADEVILRAEDEVKPAPKKRGRPKKVA